MQISTLNKICTLYFYVYVSRIKWIVILNEQIELKLTWRKKNCKLNLPQKKWTEQEKKTFRLFAFHSKPNENRINNIIKLNRSK